MNTLDEVRRQLGQAECCRGCVILAQLLDAKLLELEQKIAPPVVAPPPVA